MFRLIGMAALAVVAMAGTAVAQVVEINAHARNPTLNGRKLLRALNRIPSPSATNPWVIKLEPGIYDLDEEALVMRSFVDIEGSGQGVTTITGAGVFTVIAASDSEIRDLTIESTSPDPPGLGCPNEPSLDCYAVFVGAGVSARITDVTIHTASNTFPLGVKDGSVEVNGGKIVCGGFCHGVQVTGTATLRGTSITANSLLSRGIDNFGTVNVFDTLIDVGNDVALQMIPPGAVTNIHDSIIRGRHVILAGAVANIATSQVDLLGTTTTATCVASYDASFAPLASNCQP